MTKQHRRSWTGVLATLSLLASLCLITSSAVAQEVDEAVEINVTVEAFAASSQECLDAFSAFVQADAIDIVPPLVAAPTIVSFCVIVTNGGDELLTDYILTLNTVPELEWEVAATDDAADLRPGRSTLFVSESSWLVSAATPPLAVEVTSSNPDQQIIVSAPIELDRRDVSVSPGDYRVDVGQTVEVILEIDVTEWPAGALTTVLSYDHTVIEPLADGLHPQCNAIVADNLVCERLSLSAFEISVGRSAPEQWDGSAQLVSIPFVAIAPGSSTLGFDAPSVLWGTVPGSASFLLPQEVEGSVRVRTPGPLWYPDLDGDGFGDATAEPFANPVQPLQTYVEDNTDCDDADPLVSPGAIEVLLNDVDENCDGQLNGPGVVIGDVSCDGRLSILDAVLITRYEVGNVEGLATCADSGSPGMFLPAADLNGDDVVNIFDAVTLARCLVGLESEYCPGG